MKPLLRTTVAICFGVGLMVEATAQAFDCRDTRCTEMSACAEAYFMLEVCGHTKRDADGDGIPCEGICGKDIKSYEARARAQWPEGMAFIPRRALGETLRLVPRAEADESVTLSQPQEFSCGSKRVCRDMTSCDEAKYHLSICGLRKLDGDGDGVPCNSLCRQ